MPATTPTSFERLELALSQSGPTVRYVQSTLSYKSQGPRHEGSKAVKFASKQVDAVGTAASVQRSGPHRLFFVRQSRSGVVLPGPGYCIAVAQTWPSARFQRSGSGRSRDPGRARVDRSSAG